MVAGQLYTYEEGPRVGSRLEARFAPMELLLDVTEAMSRLRGAPRLSVLLDIRDFHGRERSEECLSLEGVELRTEPLD